MGVVGDAPGLLAALLGERTPRFLATRSPEAEPNVVPCLSLMPDEEQTDILFFGNFLLRKSIKNVERDGRVGILVMTPELHGWILTGDFLEFRRTGPYVERQNGARMLRYNAYTGIRNAGLVRVRSVETAFTLSRLQVAKDFALARLAAFGATRDQEGVRVPLPVRREFARMAAVKVLAWVRADGYPVIVPALSLQPKGERELVGRFNNRLGTGPQPLPPTGVPVATNVLTAEAISYQAKGRWVQSGKRGTIRVHSVYAGGPPLPGGRVA
jgi:pyridoxamine 5'-phosphate oxidase-like protein